MGGSKAQTVGYWYSFSLHMGASRGPINTLRHIKVGDLDAWTGDVTDNTEFEIEKPNLFGGESKEGGIVGTFSTFMGNAGQTFSATFKALLGGLVPDFRGMTTFTFRGKIAANNPYPKIWKFRIARWDQGWDTDPGIPSRSDVFYPAKARILLDDGRGGQIFAMNPAHIIYECYTNRLWGRGIDPDNLVTASFVSAANTFCDEGFGLCLKWTRRGDINEFIASVLNHVGAVQFEDPETGKIGIRAIRADYNPDDLPVFGYDTGLIDIEEDETGGGDSAYSEVIVNYTDAATGEEASERAQSLAIIQSLGDVASTTAAYPGLPTASLALRVAARDLNQQATFLKKFKVVLDRRGWKFWVGEVFKVTAVDRGLTEVILRVGTIEDTEFKDGRIILTCVQDVFGLPATGLTEPTLPGAWTPPVTDALPVDVSWHGEMPYRELVRSLSPADLATVEADDCQLAILAYPPTSNAIDFDIATAATGETLQVRGHGDWADQRFVLTQPLTEYETILTLEPGATLPDTLVGTAALIQAIGTPGLEEFVEIEAIDNIAGTVTVKRGVMDTVPQRFNETMANDARLWFSEDAMESDNRVYADAEVVDVALLTRLPSDTLTTDETTTTGVTMASRQARPYPPGALTVNTIPYATFQADREVASVDVALAWAHRDRVLQADQLVEHEAGSVGPEAGTTYTIEVYDDVTLLRSTTGVTADNWTYDATMITADGEPVAEAWTFVVRSVRAGLDSFSQYSFLVHRRRSYTLEITPAVETETGYPMILADLEITLTIETGEEIETGHPPNMIL